MGYQSQCKGCNIGEDGGSKLTSPVRQLVGLSPKISVRPRFSPRRYSRQCNQHRPLPILLEKKAQTHFEREVLKDSSSYCASDDNSSVQLMSPPRKLTRSPPQRIVIHQASSQLHSRRREKTIDFLCPSPLQKNRTSSQSCVISSPSHALALSTMSERHSSRIDPIHDQVVQQLNQEREVHLRL